MRINNDFVFGKLIVRYGINANSARNQGKTFSLIEQYIKIERNASERHKERREQVTGCG